MRHPLLGLGVAAALVALPAAADAASLYGVMFRTGGQTSGLNPTLYDVDPATGAATNGRAVNVNDAVGLAVSPATGTLYGLTDQFGRINNQSGQGGKNLLFTIEPATGAATGVGRTDPAGGDATQIFEGDLAFVPGTDTLYALSTRVTFGQLIRVDTATGLGTAAAQIVPGGTVDMSAMAFSPNGDLFVLDTTFPDANKGPAKLYRVDLDTGSVLQTYGSTVTLGGGAGMAFDPDTGALLIADGDTDGTADLYAYDFAAGDLSRIGATGAIGGPLPYTGLSGLAFAVPEPTTAGLAAAGVAGLCLRRRRL